MLFPEYMSYILEDDRRIVCLEEGLKQMKAFLYCSWFDRWEMTHTAYHIDDEITVGHASALHER